MNKPGKRDALNLIFSAFLILGYIVCAYFFLNMASTAAGIAPYINAIVFTVFGLVIFYATRVGEGKAVKRFSLWTLVILVIPSLYIILAQLIEGMPLHTQIANLGGTMPLDYSPLFILACVALGYGLPYTFFSGFELKDEDAEDTTAETSVDTGDNCDCGDCNKGSYVLCDAETPGALMVVDDLDTEFNKEKEIKLSQVTPTEDEIKVGSYVAYVEASSEETAEETETAESAEETETADNTAAE